MKRVALWIGGLFLVAVVINAIHNASTPPPAPIGDIDRKAIQIELAKKHLPPPDSIAVDPQTGFVVAEYELSDAQRRELSPLQTFGENALLVIREQLLPNGYKDYRVNVNGPPPGTGLVRRFGAARYIDGGSLEWMTP